MSLLSGWFRGGVRLTPVWRATLADHVVALAWSPEGRQVAAAAVSGPVWILDAAGGKGCHVLPGHKSGTSTIAWVDEGTVATIGQDGRVRLWDARTGVENVSFDAGARWGERLAVSPCRAFLASAAGKKVRLWNREGQLLQDYPAHTSTVTDLAWRPDGRELTSSAYGGISLWSPTNTEPVRRFDWKGSVLALAWSPDGRFLATGNQDATVHFWVYPDGHDLQMSGYPTKVRELAWDATSRFLATGGGCWVMVWDCSGNGPEGTSPLVLAAHDQGTKVTALAYQRQGPLLASGGGDGRVVLWRPERDARPLTEVKLDAAITRLAWSGDDNRLAVGTETGEVVMFKT